MKTQLFYSILFTLGVLTATTGCKEPSRDGQNWPPGTSRLAETGPGNTISSGENANSVGEGPIPLSTNWNQSEMNQDRESLAAYSIHFAFDSGAIRDSDHTNLQAVASVLQQKPNSKLLIEGNCDERGTEEYNRSLGERRALSSREALARLGVNPMRIATISYGKDKPADPDHTGDAWAKNRRDDYVLLLPIMATNSENVSYDP